MNVESRIGEPEKVFSEDQILLILGLLAQENPKIPIEVIPAWCKLLSVGEPHFYYQPYTVLKFSEDGKPATALYCPGINGDLTHGRFLPGAFQSMETQRLIEFFSERRTLSLTEKGKDEFASNSDLEAVEALKKRMKRISYEAHIRSFRDVLNAANSKCSAEYDIRMKELTDSL